MRSITKNIDCEQLKSKINLEFVIPSLLPHGKRYGNEWKSLNPTRSDSSPDSFCVNMNTGVWSDFATGEGGDIIALVMYLQGCDFKKATSILSGEEFTATTPTPRPNQPKAPFTPPPYDAPPLPADDYTGQWDYRDAKGALLFYVTRKFPKRYTWWTWCNGWKAKGVGDLVRPLYRLPELLSNPDKPVLLVEGEKTADAAQRLFPGYVCVCWAGGANAVGKTDFTPLAGRDVICWPDNDEPGYKAMRSVGYGRIITIKDKPKGWDLADAETEGLTKKELELMMNDTGSLEQMPIELFPYLRDSKTPRPFPMTENLKAMLDYYGIALAYNEMTNQREFSMQTSGCYEHDKDNWVLTRVQDLAALNGLPHERINQQLTMLSQSNAYHPIKDWMLSRPCENPSVLSEFLSIIKTDNDEMSQHLLMTWMLQAVTVLFDPSYTQQGCLVIQGMQGTNKTRFVNSLIPIDGAVTTGHTLAVDSIDSVREATKSFITELGELDATFRKSDIAKLKSFITKNKDTYRVPYSINSIDAPRRTVFVATVNEERFLVDETGNRRWWTIQITEQINLNHGLDMQQVWRAVYDLFKAGNKPYLTPHELGLLEDSQKDMKRIDPLEEKLQDLYFWNQPPCRYLSSVAILEELGFTKPSHNDLTRLGAILKKRNVLKEKLSTGRFYKMPDIKTYEQLRRERSS